MGERAQDDKLKEQSKHSFFSHLPTPPDFGAASNLANIPKGKLKNKNAQGAHRTQCMDTNTFQDNSLRGQL